VRSSESADLDALQSRLVIVDVGACKGDEVTWLELKPSMSPYRTACPGPAPKLR